MSNLIKFKRSPVPGKPPTILDIDLGELAINTYDGKLFLKKNVESVESIVEVGGDFPIENVIFVQKNGNDSNSGETWNSAYLTVERALQEAETRNGATTLIEVAPGQYHTEGHLDVPDNTIIKAAHRSVVFKPVGGYEERNVFRMGSGCFLEGPLFEGWRLDDMENPSEGFAVSFRPGSIITRTPYAHKIAVRTPPYWGTIAPPLDRANGNPLVGRGAGVALADGSIISPYSVFPNIMTWGATPVTHNGIGYCAKKGGLINAVNAVSIWSHKHFYAIDGGQIILSSCSTQFGDFTMVAKGLRRIVYPTEVTIPLTVNSAAATAITDAIPSLKDQLWNQLVSNNYTTGWDAEDEVFTRRDTGTFCQCIVWVLQTGNEKPMLDFARGLYDTMGEPVFTVDKQPAFIFSFYTLRDLINALPGVDSSAQQIVTALVAALVNTIMSPVKRAEPSTITAIGHTWTGIFAGVALTKIPPARNLANIKDSILELDQGVVIASGQDDQGSALFIGGMEISADTGELSGPPFQQAVNRIATRAVISRSF